MRDSLAYQGWSFRHCADILGGGLRQVNPAKNLSSWFQEGCGPVVGHPEVTAKSGRGCHANHKHLRFRHGNIVSGVFAPVLGIRLPWVESFSPFTAC